MKKSRKIIFLVLSALLVLAFATTAFAASSHSYNILGLSDEVYTKTTITKPATNYKYGRDDNDQMLNKSNNEPCSYTSRLHCGTVKAQENANQMYSGNDKGSVLTSPYDNSKKDVYSFREKFHNAHSYSIYGNGVYRLKTSNTPGA